jgi:phosphonate transport system substrate-binding protein
MCAPPYLWLRDRDPSPVVLVEAGLVFADPRTWGRPVYFADLVVRHDAAVSSFAHLGGGRLAYNDRCSLSGYYSLLERLADFGGTGFADLACSGSHQESLEQVLDGRVDAAAIDSNVLNLQVRADRSLTERLRVIESWGPFAVQPIVARADLPAALVQAITQALLEAPTDPAVRAALGGYGVAGLTAISEAAYEPERLLLQRCEALAV